MRRPWVYLAVPTLVLVLLTAAIVVASAFQTSSLPSVVQTGGAPPQDWRWPTTYAVSANGIQLTTLGMLMKATSADDKSPTELSSAPSLDYIMAFVATSADPARGEVSPDLAGLRVVDSLGNSYPATYGELVGVDGLSVAAIRFRGSPTGVKTYSLVLDRVQVGSGTQSAVDGPWRLDLIQQAHDQLRQGTFTGGPSQEMPIDVGGRRVIWDLRGSGPEGQDLSISVEEPSGALASIGIRVVPPDGAIRLLSQLDQVTPTPRRPSSPP